MVSGLANEVSEGIDPRMSDTLLIILEGSFFKPGGTTAGNKKRHYCT
jgi:hypothetical protein